MSNEMRRKTTKITKAEAKVYALVMVGEVLGSTLVTSLEAGFRLRLLKDRGRGPTEGEKGLFLAELSKVISGLQKRAERVDKAGSKI